MRFFLQTGGNARGIFASEYMSESSPSVKSALVPTLFLFFSGSFALSAAELWKHDSPDDVKSMHVTFAGNFIYGTDRGLYSLEPATGKVAWERDDLKEDSRSERGGD